MKDINLLEAIQRCAAHWQVGSSNLYWSVSNDDCYLKLCLLSLCARWDYLLVCTLQDIRHTNTIPFQFIVPIIPCWLVVMCSRHHQLSKPDDIHFLRVCLFWNAVPINILEIKSRSSFCHAAYKHFCWQFYYLLCNLSCLYVSCVYVLGVLYRLSFALFLPLW